MLAFSLITLIISLGVSAAPNLSKRDISCPAANGTIYQASNGNEFVIECGIDRWGGNLQGLNGQSTSTLDACITQCVARTGCLSVQWYQGQCYMKSTLTSPYAKANVWGAIPATQTTQVAPDSQSVLASIASTSSVSAITSASSFFLAVVTPTTTSLLSTDSIPTISAAKAQSVLPVITSPVPLPPATTAAPLVSTTSSVPASISTPAGSCVKAKALSAKRGLCYNVPGLTTFFSDSVTWAYNWDQTPGAGLDTALEYVPMLWGSAHVDTWSASAKAAIAAGADSLMSFNEPDLDTQADLSVSQAVALYQQYMQPFACQARLGAPAVTNGAAPLGLTYLQDFMTACTGCQIDFIPIHYYAPPNVADFQAHVQDAYAKGGNRPVWVTEFGTTGASDDETAAWLQEVLPWLDSQDYVERYSYFYDGANSLINAGSNALSPLGRIYDS
jgi:hypothetical protein